MADTPKEGETSTTQPLENKQEEATTPQPTEVKKSQAEIEAERRASQAEMRANQLANELKKKQDADAEAERKRLEQNDEFKKLYEQTQAELETIKTEQEREAKRLAVAEAASKVLTEYPDEVKAIAEDTGLELNDDSDEAVKAFKDRLDKIHTRIGGQKVSPNNPTVPTGKKQYSREELYLIFQDPAKRDAYYRQQDGLTAQMMDPKS